MSKQVAIVTGASSGIGVEIARQLAHNNYAVAMLSRSIEPMNQIQCEIEQQGGVALAIQCDISDPSNITAALIQVQKKLGSITVLINNAGFGGPAQRMDKVSLEEWDYLFAVNVRSAFLLSQPILLEMEKIQFGRIVNISSILGLKGAENASAYIASKHALIGLTRAIAAEYGANGITCNAICPGYINTPMLENNSFSDNLIQYIPMKRLGTSLEIAKLVLFFVGKESYYLNGSIITADGGLLA